MLLQKAKNFIPNISVLNKHMSNTVLGWKKSPCPFSNKRIYTEASWEVARELNLPSRAERGTLPTPGRVWRRENHRSSSWHARRYTRGCTNGLWPNGSRKDPAARGGAQCPLARPQQKALRVQSHVALLVIDPQFILSWSHLWKQVLSFCLLT